MFYYIFYYCLTNKNYSFYANVDAIGSLISIEPLITVRLKKFDKTMRKNDVFIKELR